MAQARDDLRPSEPQTSDGGVVMDGQIALLRAILAGEQPATPQNLARAFNKDVVTARAVAVQQKAADATMEALETERERLEGLVEQQRQVNCDLKFYLENDALHKDGGRGPPLEKIRSHVSALATKYIAPLGLGEPQTVDKILWRLIEVGARGEQLIVPADMPIVKFLGEEGLIESQPAYAGQLRIRLV